MVSDSVLNPAVDDILLNQAASQGVCNIRVAKGMTGVKNLSQLSELQVDQKD